MAVDADDLRICLWKILKLSSETFVKFSTRHPFFACSLLFLFLLYMLFPLIFWILFYSIPVVVCSWIVLSISFTHRNAKKYEEEENDRKYSRKAADEFVINDDKKNFTRVHSVRRRRAKDIWRENNTKNKVEEKNAVCSTNLNHEVVDKNALSEEESPKEIREVEVDQNSQVNAAKGNSSPVYRIGILKRLKDDEENRDDDEDEQKNVMDIGISEVERNKRLESLIARRRSRKLLSLQVRRTLMNMDRNDQTAQIPSLFIPKLHSSVPSPFSPGPGSAPSVLVPMRNPFDLPYDPQEEKPDLTGDSFQLEFLSVNNTRDMMFCRHESFSLGVFSPKEFNHSREETSFVHGHRASFQGNQFFKPENETEQESHQVSEAKPTREALDDQIKEIIEVYEDDIPNHIEEGIDEVETRHVQEKDFASRSSSQSSSEEDEPIYKIDKEAILKSLSSMARRNVVEEIENNDQEGDGQLDYDAYSFENSTRLKEQYHNVCKTMRRHAPSYSIASDLQVEVSEVSSPPTTIDENFSCQDENMSTCDEDMEKKISWDNEGLWASSSHLSEVDENESRPTQVTEVTEQDIIKVGFSRINESENTTMPNSMEEPSNEIHCIHSHRATNLDEKIYQTFERSISSKEISRGNGSGKLMENNVNQIEQSTRIEPESDEHILGQHERLDECHEMEQLLTKSMKSSEDLEEMVENHVIIESIQHIEGEQSSNEANITQTTPDRVDPQASSLMQDAVVEQFPLVQNFSLLSPTSVLLPTLDQGFVSSSDHDIDEDVQRFSTQTIEVSSPIVVMEQSIALPSYNGEVELLQESTEPLRMSFVEVDDTESVNKHKIHENGVELEGGPSGSSQRHGTHEVPVDHIDDDLNSSLAIKEKIHENGVEPKEGPNGSSQRHGTHETPANHIDDSNSLLGIKEKIHENGVEPKEGPNGSSQRHGTHEAPVDHIDDSNSLLGIKEELYKHHEKVIEETTNNIHHNKSNSDEEKPHEPQHIDVDESPILVLGLVEDYDNSESCKMINSHESKAIPEDKLETINTFNGETSG